MAYYLKFDGVNDYAEISTVTPPVTGSFGFRFVGKFDNSVLDRKFVDLLEGSGNRLIIGTARVGDGERLELSFQGPGGGLKTFTSRIFDINTQVDFTVTIDLDNGDLTLDYDGNQEVLSSPHIGRVMKGFRRLMSQNSGTSNLKGDLYLAQYLVNGAVVHSYEPSVSNGTGLTLTDTVGNNNATLVGYNPPNDDNQWVFYSEGSTSSNAVLFDVSKPAFSISGSSASPSITTSVSLDIGKPTFSAAANNTAPVVSSSIAFDVGEPVFNASVVNTKPVYNASLSFAIDKPTFSVSGANVAPSINSSVSFSIAKPEFNASASVTVPTGTVAVSFAVAEPEFNASATRTIPVFSSEIDIELQTPDFSVFGGSSKPIYDKVINLTLSDPLFSITASADVPAGITIVSFEIDKPIFSGAATNTIPIKSASITLEMLEPQFSITGNAFAIGDYEPTIPLITGSVGTTLITGTISTQLITGKLTNL